VGPSLRSVRVGVTQATPGRLIVRALRTDPLDEPFGPGRCPPGTYEPHQPTMLYVGRDDFGNDRYLPLRGLTGICVSGLPGYGKTSLIASWVCQLTATTPPKTAAGRRVVIIPAPVLPAIEDHLTAHALPGPDGLLFTSPGGRLLRHSAFRNRVWVPAVTATGLTGVHFHDLRHAGNNLAAEAGANLRELMERMGHASSRAALIYLHSTPDRQRAIADAIGMRAINDLGRPT
jgi:hypothetical protein